MGRGTEPRLVRRFLDKGDKASTSSLKCHAYACWGRDLVDKAKTAGGIDNVRKGLKGAELRDGTITAVFERVGKGMTTYSHTPHTRTETR